MHCAADVVHLRHKPESMRHWQGEIRQLLDDRNLMKDEYNENQLNYLIYANL